MQGKSPPVTFENQEAPNPCPSVAAGITPFPTTKTDLGIWGSGRNFDFCYGSGVKTKPGAKIKEVVVMALPLGGLQGTDHMFATHYEGETFGLE
jgi:hypothetical protein